MKSGSRKQWFSARCAAGDGGRSFLGMTVPEARSGKDLGRRIAAELEGDQGKEDALAGAGWPDHERVPDIADMEREPERRRAFGLGEQERRTAEMLVALRPGPHGRERDHVREIERRDRRLADIGTDVTGQAPEPGLERIDALRNAVKSRPWFSSATV